jgi:paraquat-inducible protein A
MSAESHLFGRSLHGCPRCGLVQRVAAVPDGCVARCARCAGVVLHGGAPWRNQLCAAIALAALVLFPLGVGLPVMRLEQLGHVHETSIWAGSISLMAHGQVVIGLIVLVCSVVIPLLKLGGLFMLTSRWPNLARHHQAAVYRAIEAAGRWGMIDVLLVAVTIAAVKLGDLVVVTPGPGVVAFGACVLLSLLASAVFNPHAIWEKQ